MKAAASGPALGSGYIPSRGDFVVLARQGNLVPVARQLMADLETPVSAFLKLRRPPFAFLLESVEGGEKWGRYSFLGTEPARVIRIRDGCAEVVGRDGEVERCEQLADPIPFLRQLLAAYRPAALPGLPRFAGGAVGYLGYDMVRFFERLPARAPDDLGLPTACLLLAHDLVIFDHVTQRITVLANVEVGGGRPPERAYDEGVERVEKLVARLAGPLPPLPSRPSPLASGPPAPTSNLTPEAYQEMVRRAKEHIAAGDVIQVVLAQRFELPLRVAPFNLYRALRSINPSPYMFFLELGDHTLAGASPEVMVRVEGREVVLRPIAGTRPRGRDDEEDRCLEAQLRGDPKERAEHIMLVDLGRNDVGRVARVGSVEVTETMVVERYSHVMHLVSNVRGELAPGCDCLDALRAAFPAGTLTGAPKIRAMEIIEELEPVRRGIYGGAVGYLSFCGAMDTAIAIRTLLLHGGRLYLQAGAGIVADSDPAAEYRECVNKAQAMVQAARLAESL